MGTEIMGFPTFRFGWYSNKHLTAQSVVLTVSAILVADSEYLRCI